MLDRFSTYILACSLCTLGLVGCGGSKEPPAETKTDDAAVETGPKVDESGLPIPADTKLVMGMGIFTKNCADCHVDAFEAPDVLRKKAWAKRVAKGAETLYGHAINGYDEMPAKGDNPDLKDEEVKAAVDYILFVHKTI